MKKFVMSKYCNQLDLYQSKSEYYQAITKELLEYLVITGDVIEADDEEYWWAATGEHIG